MSMVGLITLTPSPPLPPGPEQAEPVEVERRDEGGEDHGQDHGGAADGAGAGLAGAGVHAEPLRVDAGRRTAERAAPPGDVGRLLQIHHQQEADRGEEEHHPRDAAAQQADRDAVDGQERQPGQRDAPEPTGQQVHHEQAGRAAGDHQRRDAGRGGRDRRLEALRGVPGVGERVRDVVGAVDRVQQRPHRSSATRPARRPGGGAAGRPVAAAGRSGRTRHRTPRSRPPAAEGRGTAPTGWRSHATTAW